MSIQYSTKSKITGKAPETAPMSPTSIIISQMKTNLSLKSRTAELDFQIKYKTEMCKNWEAGHCEFGEKCAFAHGDTELRDKAQISLALKTKECKLYQDKGYCVYGNKCQFSHKESSQETASNSPENSAFSSRRNSSETIHKVPLFIDLESRWC
ncbi:unnamed protein product [Blepharisma stoltei]|uniref:C3H1-type domain-containing protein n=1 Tax=Blepharisma stoltei TaxID=1481888 RepID=A0AAU9I9X6_9CILI|nr:unnamed protein product [Blepharisma stoltei]